MWTNDEETASVGEREWMWIKKDGICVTHILLVTCWQWKTFIKNSIAMFSSYYWCKWVSFKARNRNEWKESSLNFCGLKCKCIFILFTLFCVWCWMIKNKMTIKNQNKDTYRVVRDEEEWWDGNFFLKRFNGCKM